MGRAAGPVGVVANAASGKDVRRLVAHASVVGNDEKRNVVRRVVAGAVAAGATELVYLSDPHRLVEAALDGLRAPGLRRATPLPGARTATAADTTEAAAAMREMGCRAVVVLGGDGTNRAVARGWRDAPVVAISTGTNNAFPRPVEGTVAGMAAALVATGALGLDEVAHAAPVVEVRTDGGDDDLALVDAVVLRPGFVGARALWDPARLRLAVVTRPDPAAVGLAALAGLCAPAGRPVVLRFADDPAANGPDGAPPGARAPGGTGRDGTGGGYDGGGHRRGGGGGPARDTRTDDPSARGPVAPAGAGRAHGGRRWGAPAGVGGATGPRRVRAALAPGLVREVAVAEVRELAEGEEVEVVGPCLLAFDGERERSVPAGTTVRLRVAPDGPRVIDVGVALRLAAERRLFEGSGCEEAHGRGA